MSGLGRPEQRQKTMSRRKTSAKKNERGKEGRQQIRIATATGTRSVYGTTKGVLKVDAVYLEGGDSGSKTKRGDHAPKTRDARKKTGNGEGEG